MSEPAPTPRRPTTEAQRARVRRILDVATMLVTSGGPDALQMSDVPELAGVSLAALYGYFPSKQHLLFAVVEEHLESILARTRPPGPVTASVREQTATHLLRGFHVDQRVPSLGLAVRQLSTVGDPTFSAERERIARLHGAIVGRTVGPMTERQRETLGVVLTAANAAVLHWFAGIMAADEVRFQILLACRLLDLPEELIAADRHTAQPGARSASH